MGNRKSDETKPDRAAAPLPSITAPRFERGGHAAPPEVSVTSPVTVPEVEEQEERTRTETQLDPAAYTATPDKDPDELSSEFQPISGKELDARGRLVKHALPEPEPAPLPPEDVPPTEVAVPQPPPARRSASRPADRVAPAAPEPPVQKVAAKRRQPGRWILDQEGHVAKESAELVEPEAFDPTVLKPAPSARPRRIPRRAIGAAAAVVVLLLTGAAVWTFQASQGQNAGETSQAPDAGAPAVARIQLTSRPSGAVVRINGLPFGTTPVDRESPFAPEAELEVEVVLKGYRPWTRRFHSGQSIAAHAQLKPAR